MIDTRRVIILFDIVFFVVESAGEDEEEAAEEDSMNNRNRDTDTYIDIPKTDGMLPISSLLEKPPVLDKKVKVKELTSYYIFLYEASLFIIRIGLHCISK